MEIDLSAATKPPSPVVRTSSDLLKSLTLRGITAPNASMSHRHASAFLKTGQQAESPLADGVADLVTMASQMLLASNWAATSVREPSLGGWCDALPKYRTFRRKRQDAHPRAHEYRASVRISSEVGSPFLTVEKSTSNFAYFGMDR